MKDGVFGVEPSSKKEFKGISKNKVGSIEIQIFEQGVSVNLSGSVDEIISAFAVGLAHVAELSGKSLEDVMNMLRVDLNLLTDMKDISSLMETLLKEMLGEK